MAAVEATPTTIEVTKPTVDDVSSKDDSKETNETPTINGPKVDDASLAVNGPKVDDATPTDDGPKVDDNASSAKGPEGDDAVLKDDSKEKEKKTYSRYPKFKVTWDPKIPSLMSNKNPKKKTRNSVITERFGLPMAQEMSPQATLVEFIATSASFHGVRRQSLQALEDELFRVFRNNIMPANAAAWYMAKRRFYNKGPQNELLAMLLKEYPKKFAIMNNVVQFLESYTPAVARAKMRYLVEQGLYAYFSHKADEYGVYFFDPLYYEQTEPFHANLRIVTNAFSNASNKLVSHYFRLFKKEFYFQQISQYLVCISKNEPEVVTGVTGVLVQMLDKKYGLIKFNRGTENCIALFSMNALFKDGYQYRRDPTVLPPVYLDAYKIPNAENLQDKRFQWFAVLAWVGRKPNLKFCSNRDELVKSRYYKMIKMNNNDPQDNLRKPDENASYMKMGTVTSIKKNGCVTKVATEDGKEENYFVPGWTYNHLNIPRVKFLTTTQGIGLCVGDLINFYVDPKMEAVPYTGVACNVDVLKHVENMSKGKGKKRRRRNSSVKSKVSTTQKKVPIREWKKFLLKDELDEVDGSEVDPEYQPPANLDDSEDDDSNISEEEIRDLAESMKIDLKLEELIPKEGCDLGIKKAGCDLGIEKAIPKVDAIEVALVAENEV
jgi:hypothetical protein